MRDKEDARRDAPLINCDRFGWHDEFEQKMEDWELKYGAKRGDGAGGRVIDAAVAFQRGKQKPGE